jgi:hypothetical protein
VNSTEKILLVKVTRLESRIFRPIGDHRHQPVDTELNPEARIGKPRYLYRFVIPWILEDGWLALALDHICSQMPNEGSV